LILVSGPAIKVTFKAHFMTSFAKKLAAPLYRKSLEEIQEEQGLDFMREFCNLTAGAIKRVLLKFEQKTGVSIPVVTRGFDELFFPRSSLPNVFHDLWTLRCEVGQLHCSVVIELFEKMDLRKVTAESADPNTDQGDVEFL
ncbi:MAG: chemotaxis protein CheX, partial [Bdellovibrio sp.]